MHFLALNHVCQQDSGEQLGDRTDGDDLVAVHLAVLPSDGLVPVQYPERQSNDFSPDH
jgi:hypothetical protein